MPDIEGVPYEATGGPVNQSTAELIATLGELPPDDRLVHADEQHFQTVAVQPGAAGLTVPIKEHNDDTHF